MTREQPRVPGAGAGLDFRLDGCRALVTGAGGGLGRSVADGLASLGASVVGTSRNAATADELADRYGTEPCVLDVRDVASFESVVGRVWAERPLDVLVNNAGVNRPQPMLEVDEQSWDEIQATNLKGAFFLTQAVARRLVAAQRPGSVVTIGSQAGLVGIEERAAYAASKGGVTALTRVMAIELAAHGIRVNAVAPTFVSTALTRSTLERPELREAFLARIPLGRFGEPDDVAAAVAFLVGPMAGLITGHTLVVDGGWTAW
ncbi:SDR family NAD(P)-dependent oxidoreductase [Dactylosporangium sp. NPDC000555]|uniref:SDR family NAD(P)-dependent oxidoreductase n=1 Tax=Dactylosporangium sp. NPDC000555 TaxID=3154260 RepID=UPI00332548C9